MSGPRWAVCAGLAVGTLLAFGAAQGAAPSVPKEWQALDLAGLTRLARDLDAKGDAGSKDRQALADFVAKRYASHKAAGKVDWNAWLDLAAIAGPQLSDDARKAMASDLVEGMRLKDSAALAALADGQILRAAGTLGRLGWEDEGRAACAAWINASDRYRAADPATLHALGWNVSPQGKAFDAARGRLTEHLQAKVLSDPAAVRSMGGDNWHALALDVGKQLPAETRSLWVARLRAAFVGDAKATGTVKGEEMIELAQALDALGDNDLPSFFVTWVRACDTWQALKPGALPWLIDNLARSGDAGKVLKPRVAEHVTRTLLAAPEAARTVAYWDWHELVFHLKDCLGEGTRATWVSKLQAAFLGPKELASAPQDVVWLRDTLEALGDKDADGMLAAWMTAGTGWQSAEPWALRVLAESLAKGGDATKPLRDRLADHVGRKYLAGPEATWKGGCFDWKGILQSLAGDMDTRTRQLWIAKLRAVFLDPKALASQDSGIVFLWEALDGLGDRDAHTVLAAWMQAGPTWQSAGGDDLTRLAYGLGRGGEVTQPQRAQLLEHVLKVRLATPQAIREISCWAWYQLVLALGQGADDPARRMWRERLHAAYGDAGTLAGLAPEKIIDLSEALERLGDARSYDVVVTAMAADPQWRSLDVHQTTRLCQRLARGGAATKAQRLDLAGVVAARYLATPEAARSVGRWDWKEWAGTLGKELDVGSRRQWVARLREEFTKPEVLAAMPLGEVRDLTDALQALGDGEAPLLVAAWVSAGTAWQSLQPAELAGVAVSLCECGDGGKAARLRLMEYVTRAYLAAAESARKAGPGQWSALIQGLAGELGPEARRAWAGTLRAAFVAPKALASLEKQDVLALAWVLEALGEKTEAAYGVAASWMAATPAWQSLKPEDLRELADALDRGGEEAKAERLRLVEHLTGKHLASADGVRAATCGEWRGLAGFLGKDMGAETRRTWTTALRNAFAGAKALAHLKPAEVLDLVGALDALGDKEACGVVVAWMQGGSAWQSLDAGGLRRLAECLERGGEAAKAMRLRLAEHLTTSRLGTQEMVRTMTCGEWRGLAGSLAKDLDPAAREVWAGKIRGAFADPRTMASMKPQEVVNLAVTLDSLGDKRVPDILTSWILNKK